MKLWHFLVDSGQYSSGGYSNEEAFLPGCSFREFEGFILIDCYYPVEKFFFQYGRNESCPNALQRVRTRSAAAYNGGKDRFHCVDPESGEFFFNYFGTGCDMTPG